MGRRNLTPLGLATLVTVVTGAGLLVFRTPLMREQRAVLLNHAAVLGDCGAARFLFLLGCEPNSALRSYPALYSAVWYGHLPMAKLLLERGADPNAATEGNVTPLMVAAQQGRDDLVKLLVDHGASPAARCAGGTAHDLALRAGHPGTAALLTP